jgi:hypothetical protein
MRRAEGLDEPTNHVIPPSRTFPLTAPEKNSGRPGYSPRCNVKHDYGLQLQGVVAEAGRYGRAFDDLPILKQC